ncbi:response regulator [Pyxidicoccus fallax]|uniref:histidine kinase n=1 Tax=Pyxidicoccus fallax TaxID=394095 RepID=A0A848L5V2_9BACT|nr:ATP-binding protein [Pyxidicoccus fallax]NMO14064.1 hybrid sensor histidine kinase/response regulator [Pyxidicoccus fallax]NPC78128.1 response regulator [Pyxidicoccus fallax]
MSLVLVADDEPAVLEVLSQVVEDLGHDVLRARDGEEALGLARARRPQLVVTDHMMPRLSGVELCRRLKQEEQLKDVPIILLSAVLPQGAPEASAFLHKPFEITDFESVIRQSLAAAPAPRTVNTDSPVEVLGQWVAQTLQGPVDTAREQLKRLEAAPAVDRSALSSLEAQLQSLEALGRNLKDVARLAAGGLALQPVEADLAQHLRDAVTSWKVRAPVALVAPSEPVSVRFDPERVRQIFDVLLANAVSQNGGRGEVKVEMQASRSLVTVQVKDVGPGFPEEEVPRLFTPFQSGPAGIAGLGLHVASELARLHGGALSAVSRPGHGSTFSLLLPRG